MGEAAFLGALPKAPNNYNPLRYPEAARPAATGCWTAWPKTARSRRRRPTPPRRSRSSPGCCAGPRWCRSASYFTEEVRRELISRFGPEQTTMGGLVVRTSIEPPPAGATEQALRGGLLAYDRRRGGWRGPVARVSAGAADWMPQLEAVHAPRRRAAGMAAGRGAGGPRPRGQARLGGAGGCPRAKPAAHRDASAWMASPGAGRRCRRAASRRCGRMQDVLAVGDVVPVEVLHGRRRPAGRLALRQVPADRGGHRRARPANGRVLAMVGGWSFDKSQFNRATQAQRQPGSSFKPFVYLPALEAGVPPNQRFLDGPIEVMTPQGVWRPGNYTEGSFNGYVSIRTALQKSLNLVTMRVAQEVGMAKVSDAAARFGVIDSMPRYLPMALGSGETTVLRMAAGYAGFASGGKRVTPS